MEEFKMMKEMRMDEMMDVNGGTSKEGVKLALTIEAVVTGALTEGIIKVVTGKTPGDWAAEGIKHVWKEMTSPDNKKELQNNPYVKIFGN